MNIGLFAIYLVFFGGLLYLLLILPQRRRLRAQESLITSLEVGDEVVTLGGLFGTVRNVDGEKLSLEIAEGVSVKVAARAVAQRIEHKAENPTENT